MRKRIVSRMSRRPTLSTAPVSGFHDHTSPAHWLAKFPSAGFELGFAYALLGYWLAGGTGYVLARVLGRRVLLAVTRDQDKLAEMDDLFHRHGLVVLSMARAVPILAEVSACLAGATKMPPARFALGWAINSVPYAAIAAYAGSVSSLEDPKPAIFAAIGLTGVLWTGWYVFRRLTKRAAQEG